MAVLRSGQNVTSSGSPVSRSSSFWSRRISSSLSCNDFRTGIFNVATAHCAIFISPDVRTLGLTRKGAGKNFPNERRVHAAIPASDFL